MIISAANTRSEAIQVISEMDSFMALHDKVEAAIKIARENGKFEVDVPGVDDSFYAVFYPHLTRLGYKVVKTPTHHREGSCMTISWWPDGVEI